MKSKIFIPKIGDVVFVVNKNAKRINIKVSPTKGVIVVIPINGNIEEAQKFLISKTNWVLQSLQKVQSLKSQITVFDSNTEFSTNKHKLHLVPESRTDIKGEIWQNKIIITYPKILNVKEDAFQQFVRKMIEEAWRAEAKEYLPKRINELAEIHNFAFKKLYIKNLKSRWGSCSGVNNINLSIHLMRLPKHLIDYVILHELVHTIHKNHSFRFWDCLEKHIPYSKELAKKIRTFNIAIF